MKSPTHVSYRSPALCPLLAALPPPPQSARWSTCSGGPGTPPGSGSSSPWVSVRVDPHRRLEHSLRRSAEFCSEQPFVYDVSLYARILLLHSAFIPVLDTPTNYMAHCACRVAMRLTADGGMKLLPACPPVYVHIYSVKIYCLCTL